MNVRPAVEQDVAAIHAIIGHYATQGTMLPRSKGALTHSLSHFLVAEDDGEVIGCGGLQPYGMEQAELYGLAIRPGKASQGCGRSLVSALMEKAQAENISEVFALTLAPQFFDKLGFHRAAHASLPLKVWKDCVACPKFGHCDEVAMLRRSGPAG